MDLNSILSNISNYVGNYSPTKLFEKIGSVASKAGAKAVYAVLFLYHAITDNEVPLKDKALVVGALGYFILPLDIIPDFMGPLGYTDDVAVATAALKAIWGNITPKTKGKTRRRLIEWFCSVNSDDLELFLKIFQTKENYI